MLSCDKCKYGWEPRKKVPVRCPRCKVCLIFEGNVGKQFSRKRQPKLSKKLEELKRVFG